jgi:CIC family chloride channel protein
MPSIDSEPKPSQATPQRKLESVRRFLIRRLAVLGITGTPFLIALSVVIGIAGGVGSLMFRWLIEFFNQTFLVDVPNLLGTPYALPFVTMFGFLAVSLIVNRWAKEAKGHGVPEVMAAVATNNGVIRPRVAIIKSIASALCIGSGGSVGREGPIVQIGSATGSAVGQMLGFTGERLKVLVGCGAAAGISATFNAPIAGGFFALEVILGDFSISTFSPILFASVIAAAFSRSASGNETAFIVPEYNLTTSYELFFYVALALLSGFVAVFFSKMLYAVEDFFDRIPISVHLKACLGGLMVGGIGLFFPQILGVGYDTITGILLNQINLTLILALLAVKLVATSFTLGAGGSGGVFAPSLFIGASVGGAFGFVLNALFPDIVSEPGAYALVGMGAVVAGTTHAPLTAMLILFELTDDYEIILPLILGTVISSLFSRYLDRESIYTLKLARRGLRISQGFDMNVLGKLTAGDAMSTEYEFVRTDTPLGEISALFQNSTLVDFPVVNATDGLKGIIPLSDIKPVVFDHDLYNLLIAEDMMSSDPPYIEADAPLVEALALLAEGDVSTLPLVENSVNMKLVGVLTHQGLMVHYHREIQRIDGERVH